MTGCSRTAYRREPVASEAEWGSVGHRNWWGGFHRTTDTYAYLGLLRLVLVNLLHPRVARYPAHLMRDRWRHRGCDTVDFHHFACTLDPFGKRMDDEYRWQRVWTAGNASDPLPLHRAEAGYPRCATCDGGGCLDCTDPA